MNRQEAEAIIRSILDGPRPLDRTGHFMENLTEEGFTLQDINPILKSHSVRGAVEARPNGTYRMRLIGKCLEGRPTLLVMDLRVEGPCTLVSIMEDKASPGSKKRRAR